MNKPGNQWRYGIMVVGLIALVVLIRDFNSRMADLRRLTREHEKVSAEATDAVATVNVLQTQETYAQSDQAAAEWAYTSGGMARPGDQVIYPQSAGTVPTPISTTPQATPQVIENWQLWMSLFVDSPGSH